MKEKFAQFAQWLSRMAGHAATFAVVTAAIVAWAATGPLFKFSDTWQLVVNTATSVVTFLMVFIIQNTQNRDTAALQIKLDELIRASAKAQNVLLDLEHLDDEALEKMRKQYQALAHEARSGKKQQENPAQG